MNIKLDHGNPSELNTVNPAAGTGMKAAIPLVGNAVTARETGDTAEISEVAGLVAEEKDQPDLRLEKVAAIKAQIEAGLTMWTLRRLRSR